MWYLVVQVSETSFLEETRNQLEHAISQAKRPEEVKIVQLSSCEIAKLWNCSQKWKLDTVGCNALPLSPRVQSGRRRGCRRRPGFLIIVDLSIWSSLILPFVIWPLWSYHLIMPGSTECRTCWNSTNPDEYGTGWEVRWGLIAESNSQNLPDIRLSLCEYWRTIATMNPMHFQHFNWSQHHDDIQGTLLLMGQVQFFWLNLI